MSFNDEVLKPGRGRAIRVEGSIDGFATILYRWGEVAGELGGPGNMYSARIVSLSPIRRALGQNRMAAAGTCELVLNNADGALDALTGAASLDTQAKLRFRIWLDIYDPQNLPADLSANARQLGEYALSTWIHQDDARLVLSLADDVVGAVAQQASLPTPLDWHNVGGSAATNPLFDGYATADSITENSPIQLAFGEDWVLALPHIIPFGTVDAAYQDKVIVPICVTSSTAAASATEITELRVNWYDANAKRARLVDIRKTVWDEQNHVLLNVWTVERSPTITKNGHSFKVIYLVVRADLGALSKTQNYITGGGQVIDPVLADSYGSSDYGGEWLGNYAPYAVYQMRGYHSNHAAAAQYGQFAAGVLSWFVKGVPLSARTQTTLPVQHPVDVLTDLVSYYSNNTAITVNTTEGARMKAATRMAACAGVVQPWTAGPKRGDPIFQQPPSLRQTITAICQSSDFDAFIDWSGRFSFATDFWDLQFASTGGATWTPDGGLVTSGNGSTTPYIPAVIPETWIDSLERWLPADGERWAPFNRLWFNGGKASPADNADVPYPGPWDFDSGQPASLLLASRIIEATLQQGWRPFRQQAQAPWYWRSLNIVARDMVKFRTHIGGLQLELGQYFALSWTRGPNIGTPYYGAIFQCEGLTYSSTDDSVEVTAVWRDDVTTERQYLLDDETLLVRSKGALTGSASPVPGGTQVDFAGSINLTTMGVAVGDIIVLRYSGEAADSFLLNAAFRITSFTAFQCFVTPSFDGAAPAVAIANAEWSILRGATTYPTVVSDPTNYLLGGDMYGKTTTAGVYSNAAVGNRLISG